MKMRAQGRAAKIAEGRGTSPSRWVWGGARSVRKDGQYGGGAARGLKIFINRLKELSEG